MNMKNTFILAAASLFLTLSAFAQGDTTSWDSDKSDGGWQEKVGNKIIEKVQKVKDKKNAPVNALVTESIVTVAGRWSKNNKLSTFAPYGLYGALKGGRYVYITMVDDENGYVKDVHVGFDLNDDKSIKNPLIYEGYISDLYMGNLWYFKDPFSFEYWATNSERIFMTDNSVVFYTVVDKKTEEVKNLGYVAGKKGKNVASWENETEAYRRFALDKQEADKIIIKQAEADFRAKYSLEHKEVTDIQVVYLNDEGVKGAEVDGYVKVGLIATLADGTKDKTHNLGGNLYIEDFIDDSGDLNKEYKNDKYGGNCHCGYGSLRVKGNKAPGEKDVYTAVIKPKYAGAASVTITLPLVYRSIVETRSAGATYNVKIKMTKHSETGEDLVYAKLGKTNYVKIKLDGTLGIDVSGSSGGGGSNGRDCYDNGCTAGDSGDGGDGGDGGDVSVIRAKNVTRLKLNLSANAGSGGMPGMKGHALGDYGTDGYMGTMGSPGSSGSTSEKVGSVSF
jgi:hypothetical protein